MRWMDDVSVVCVCVLLRLLGVSDVVAGGGLGVSRLGWQVVCVVDDSVWKHGEVSKHKDKEEE